MTASDAASITVVRTIAAPIGKVFAAWTDPRLLRQWFAPAPCEVAELHADPRPGGTYRMVLLDPTGARHVIAGEYREVVPNARIVKTCVAEGMHPSADHVPSLITVALREIRPGTTEITIRQDQLRTLEDREGNREGWRLCLNALDALVRS